jgi:two-component system, response regulator, stage 0 sporulation protein F
MRSLLTLAVISKTVLIADDTAFVRDRFGAVLTDAGHQAVLVASAGELLTCVREQHRGIDLLVLDLRLPQSRGIETIRAIRQYGAKFPILVFSGTIASADEVRELWDLGVAGFINEYSTPQHILPAIAPHLFPDSFNRRSSPRVALVVTVSYRFEHTIASATCANVSKGGMGLRTMNPLPSGTKIRLRFKLPGSKREIEADATVAWSDQRTGMGLQFGSLDAESQAELDDYVDKHFFSNRRA